MRLDALGRLSDFGGFERARRKNVNNKNVQFWQQDNHPIELNSNEMMEDRVLRKISIEIFQGGASLWEGDYIHQNPVKEGKVLSPEDKGFNFP